MFKLTQLLFLALSFTVIRASTNNIFCYYESWAIYNDGDFKFGINDIDPTRCTHITYSFLGLNSDGTVKILDKNVDIDQGGFNQFVNLKKKNANLKVLISMGGWDEASKNFSPVFNDAAKRQTLVNSIYNFIQKYKFDGLDLDWEYPAKRGGITSDKTAYITFLKELRNKFGAKLLITAAVGADLELLSTSYNAAEMSKYLDFINLMTYDYHSSDDGATGCNSPLYAGDNNDREENMDATVTKWINAGANPQKLLLGLGAYGISYTLSNPSKNGLNAKTSGPGKGDDEQSTYLGICKNIKNNGWTLKYDDKQECAYAFRRDQWVGFDTPQAFTAKAKYARSKNLGGIMLWAIDMEDKKNLCGGGSWPLISAVQAVLK